MSCTVVALGGRDAESCVATNFLSLLRPSWVASRDRTNASQYLGFELRRRWSTKDKLKVLADGQGVSRNLLFTWLKPARKGELPGVAIGAKATPAFVRYKVAGEPVINRTTSPADRTSSPAHDANQDHACERPRREG